jgi:hypothetical protein
MFGAYLFASIFKKLKSREGSPESEDTQAD